jgi:hypothetical protein
MRLLDIGRCLRSRLAGLGFGISAMVAMLLLVSSAAIAQSGLPNKWDSRFPDDDEFSHAVPAHTEFSARMVGYDRRPRRCAVEIPIRSDYPNAAARSKSQPNPVAALKRFEMGYELRGDTHDTTDLHAFIRLKIERVDDGTPLRVERIVYDYRALQKTEHSSTKDWIGEALDAEGYGKISMPVDKMTIKELFHFSSIAYLNNFQIFALDLPELGESRAYSLSSPSFSGVVPMFQACACAFEHKGISHPDVMSCSAPRFGPPRRR